MKKTKGKVKAVKKGKAGAGKPLTKNVQPLDKKDRGEFFIPEEIIEMRQQREQAIHNKKYGVKENGKKKTGRRLFNGKSEEIVIQFLKAAWAIGCNDAEACAYADISVTALFEYCKKHPEVSEIKNRLKQKPFLVARQSVVAALKNNPEIAFRYLERKRPEEFAPQTRVNNLNTNVNLDATNMTDADMRRRVKENLEILQNIDNEDEGNGNQQGPD